MSTYEQGVHDALTAALRALDGHGFHDTAHDRIRRLLACDECGHQPEKHGADGLCQERVSGGLGMGYLPCYCIEYEVPGLPRAASQTSTKVDDRPDASLSAPTAPKGTPDLTASAPDRAADVVGTTGPTS